MPSEESIPPLKPLAVETLAYDRPERSTAPRVWAAFFILFGGLAMVAISGCFLIGAEIIVTNSSPVFSFRTPMPPSPRSSLTSSEIMLLVILYLLSAGFVIYGAYVIVLGIRGLWKIVSQ